MGPDDLSRVRDAFVTAAELAASAGCDVLELDLAHGYLLAGFLSPLTNRRDDEYRDSRYPLEVLAAVRSAWVGPLIVRLTVTDWARRGLTESDGIRLARAVADAGADLVHVEAGQTVPDGRPDYRRGFLTGLSARVRSEARVPTLVGGYLTNRDEVNTLVAAGRADLCLLDLPLDPP